MKIFLFTILVLALEGSNAFARGRSEVARGGWGRFFNFGNTGSQNQLPSAEIIPESLTRENRPLSTNMVKINGCSESTSFKWQYVENVKCDQKLKMNDELAEFINLYFNQCVQKAANSARITIYPGAKGVVKHIGIIGDKRHSKTKSLHNYGRAVDISNISISGHNFSYENAVKNKSSKDADFFSNLRACWSESVREFSPECATSRSLTRRGGMFASVGEENKNHQKHLHLSLPYCGAEQARRNTFMANLVKKWPLLALLWIDMTIADDVTPKEESPNPVQNEVIAIPNIGEATVKIEEVGEPIAKPTLVTISLKCKNAAKEVELENDLGVCSFEKAYFSRSKKHLIVEYNSSVMLDGELACKKKNTKEYSITCK